MEADMLQQQTRRTTDESCARQTERSTRLGADLFKHALAVLVAAVRQSYRRQVARRRAHLATLELAGLEDRMLRDIGIDRADIPRLARDLAEQAAEGPDRSTRRGPDRPALPTPSRPPVAGPAVACCG
jgi:uncharacterized protein YjiS (DUF1127 family)